MQKSTFKKPKLSIKNIGQLRFWLGIFVGLVTAVIISYAFNYFREIGRFFSILQGDILIFTQSNRLFYNRFFAFFGSVLGLSIAIWFWMNTQLPQKRSRYIHLITARTNVLFVFWFYLYVIAKFSSGLPPLFYRANTYNTLNLSTALPYLFYLLIAVIFLQNWLYVQRIFNIWKWMFFSGIIVAILGFGLPYVTNVNLKQIEDSFYKEYESVFVYIDKSIIQAKYDYGVKFKPKTLKTLKQFSGSDVENQLYAIKNAFKNDKPVSLDTILIAKINFHIFKNGNGINSFSFMQNKKLYPELIYKQIKKHPVNSPETKALFELLKDMIDVTNLNADNINRSENDFLTWRRAKMKRYLSHRFFNQLERVRNELIEDKKYQKYTKELSEIGEKTPKQDYFGFMRQSGN